MVKVHTFGEKGSGKEKSMKGNGRRGNLMVMEHSLKKMESMLEDLSMGFGMVKVHTLGLMGIKG
tara:strand:+ start:742 stop:933 length:192 start_codon:yes stop_codon:yes gene_type:complete